MDGAPNPFAVYGPQLARLAEQVRGLTQRIADAAWLSPTARALIAPEASPVDDPSAHAQGAYAAEQAHVCRVLRSVTALGAMFKCVVEHDGLVLTAEEGARLSELAAAASALDVRVSTTQMHLGGVLDAASVVPTLLAGALDVMDAAFVRTAAAEQQTAARATAEPVAV